MAGTLLWAELQKAGVKRVSIGVSLYTRVMADLLRATEQLTAGDLEAASAGLKFREVSKMISDATNG